MKLVIFGLTISSSWGNGHATLWRGLIRELGRRGHTTVFFERDTPYYAEHRDLTTIDGGELILYSSWNEAIDAARQHVKDADAAMITSYCPDSIEACDLVLASNAFMRAFYDMDTPVTLAQLSDGKMVPYIPPEGLGEFDLVLSFTGGHALSELQSKLGARRVAPLYGSVDPEQHRRVGVSSRYRSDLSYLGTYSADRQDALDTLFLQVAKRLPDKRFLIGGSLYPDGFPWLPNISYMRHVSPSEHSAFYCSSTLTLNITRAPMARMGFCPSGRLFEAGACGSPIISDAWAGLDQFFEPGNEIIAVHSTEDAIEAMQLPEAELSRISRAAYDRVMQSHTARQRALELEELIDVRCIDRRGGLNVGNYPSSRRG